MNWPADIKKIPPQCVECTCGGILYVGVADDGAVTGVEDADAVILRPNNMVRDSIKPDVTMLVRYETLEIDEKKVVAATVQKGTNRPYYLAAKGLKHSGVYARNVALDRPRMQTLGLLT